MHTAPEIIMSENQVNMFKKESIYTSNTATLIMRRVETDDG